MYCLIALIAFNNLCKSQNLFFYSSNYWKEEFMTKTQNLKPWNSQDIKGKNISGWIEALEI